MFQVAVVAQAAARRVVVAAQARVAQRVAQGAELAEYWTGKCDMCQDKCLRPSLASLASEIAHTRTHGPALDIQC